MITGSLQTKRNVAYVVVSYKDNNKWKQKWLRTELDAKQAEKLGKKKKQEIEQQYVKQFEQELEEKVKMESEIQKSDMEILESYKKMPFLDFIKESLEEFKNQVQETTYDNWCAIYHNRITNFFTPIKELKKLDKVMNEEIERAIYYEKQLTISEVSTMHIQLFFKWMYDCGLKGSSVDKFYVFLNKIFKRSIRLHIIKKSENPMEDVEKPKIIPFTGKFYSPQELNKLFEIIKGNSLEVPILLGSYYGLRRSEIIGLKWDAIDYENKCIIIRHTVTKVKGVGENQVISCKDLTKTSSRIWNYAPCTRN